MGYALLMPLVPRPSHRLRQSNSERKIMVCTHVETVRKTVLVRLCNDDGTLYEGTVVDFYDGWEGSFERKTGDDKAGRAHIRKLIELSEGDSVTEEAIGELVDLDSFYRFWAMEGLLGFWDGYSGNASLFCLSQSQDEQVSLHAVGC